MRLTSLAPIALVALTAMPVIAQDFTTSASQGFAPGYTQLELKAGRILRENGFAVDARTLALSQIVEIINIDDEEPVSERQAIQVALTRR